MDRGDRRPAQFEDFGVADENGEGIGQLVAEHGQKFVLLSIVLHQFLGLLSQDSFQAMTLGDFALKQELSSERPHTELFDPARWRMTSQISPMPIPTFKNPAVSIW